MSSYSTQTIGFPRIGPQREMKRALESYWKGQLSSANLIEAQHAVEADAWQTQLDGRDRFHRGGRQHALRPRAGLDGPPGADPGTLSGPGRAGPILRHGPRRPGIPALDLTKWFDTNYHYLVPEIEPGLAPSAHFDDFIDLVRRAQASLGERAVPIVLGPVTLLRLARLSQDFAAALHGLLPLYTQLLGTAQGAGGGRGPNARAGAGPGRRRPAAPARRSGLPGAGPGRAAHQPGHVFRRPGRGLGGGAGAAGDHPDPGLHPRRQPGTPPGRRLAARARRWPPAWWTAATCGGCGRTWSARASPPCRR